jgi:hypothetical protein
MGLPVMMVDFDGVLNVFPQKKQQLRGGVRDTSSMPDDNPRKDLYSYAHAFQAYRKSKVRVRDMRIALRWSPELLTSLLELIQNDEAHWTWLSTWQPYIEDILYPVLDIDPHAVDGRMDIAQWYNLSQFNEIPGYGKQEYVQSWLKEHDEPLVWIDDEAADTSTLDELQYEFGDSRKVLMIQPNDEIGISRSQFEHIKEFLAHPSVGFKLYSEAFDTGTLTGLFK